MLYSLNVTLYVWLLLCRICDGTIKYLAPTLTAILWLHSLDYVVSSLTISDNIVHMQFQKQANKMYNPCSETTSGLSTTPVLRPHMTFKKMHDFCTASGKFIW